MNNKSVLLLLPILLPVAGGLMMPFLPTLQERRPRQIYITAFLALNAAIVCTIALQPDSALTLLYLTDRLPVLFRIDDLARFFMVLVSFMFLVVGIYAFEYIKHEKDEVRFYLFYLVVLGMLMGIGLSGNMMTLYLFFEFMTLLSVPLVLHSLTKEAIAAAFKYLFYSIAGASLGLIGFFFVYTYGDTIAFTQGGVLNAAKLAGHEGAMLVAVFITVIGFGTKAGMFPMHAWLPTAHPVAPAPASAILSGVITKAGVFAIIRYVFFLVGADFIRGTWVQYAWLSLALITVFMGSMLAYKEPLLKKRLAYSSVSQVSYVLFGLATLTAGGALGALLHVVFHSIVKDALFLAAGAIIYKTHKTRVDELQGIGKQMPIVMGCFTMVSVTLVGIPPTSGFLSKWYLATGALSADISFFSWLGPAVLLLSALLTAGYLFPISINGFFPGADFDYAALKKAEPNGLMTGPLLLLALLAVLFGILPGFLVDFCGQIVALMV